MNALAGESISSAILQKRKAGNKMEYINAFWVGGLICALVQILLDETDARADHGSSGVYRGSTWHTWNL